MRIHGIVVCRNDWGVLALSISNVLNNHADVVHVLNHGSSDQTTHGLKALQDIWGERLKVYSASPDVPFNQSLLTNMMVSIAEDSGADWIYVFDSDEFLLTQKNLSLKEGLSKLSDNIIAVRYSLSNYISTYDFDKNNLDCYKSLIYRSIPSVECDWLRAMELICNGQLSFFDIPFPSKIIFRANKNLLIRNGAHALRYMPHNHSIANLTFTYCAHLTFISKNTLARKSMQGKSCADLGFHPQLGWQNRLIHQLDLEGRLDWFWERHSIQAETGENKNPKYTIDKSLVKCLDKSIEILKEKFGGVTLSAISGVPLKTGFDQETKFTFSSIFQICEFFNRRIDILLPQTRRN